MMAELFSPEHHSNSDLPDEGLTAQYRHCVTQVMSGVDAVYVGFRNTAARWSNGFDVTFLINRASFPPSIDVNYVEGCILIAVGRWHGTGVRIRPARPHETATFIVAYQHEPDTSRKLEKGIVLSRAFFPSYLRQDRVLFVYGPCFWPRYIGFMSNVLSHGIGHILGLRHEFLEDPPSMLIRYPNPHSVMNYHEDLGMMMVTTEDIYGVQEFYSLEGRVGDRWIVTVLP
ncbi:hypothetical protein F5Y03DRAFT_375962 [Xylaria venustula]|nr:hypothetical protein F5Y03DRAFT_375962 [Xylaria venustula]